VKAGERIFYRTLEMLEDLTEICPEDIWKNPQGDGIFFWCHVYHAFFGIEFWFRTSNEGLEPYKFGKTVTPELEEFSESFLEKQDMEDYKKEIRERCREFFSFVQEKGKSYPSPVYGKLTLEDMVLMQIRHIQHHVGYLNRILSEKGVKCASWKDSWGEGR